MTELRRPRRWTAVLAGGASGNCPGHQRPISRIVNEPGTGVPCGPRPPAGGGGGAGPRSTLIVSRWLVLLSNVTVRAPFIVSRFCSTSKLVGLFSLTTVKVPLPWVLRLRASARNVQPASDDVGIDVVPAALAADPGSPEHLVGSAGRLLSRPERDGENDGTCAD